MHDEEPSALDVLRNAIKMEIEGKAFFEDAAKRMKHPRARDTFMGLVKQEQRHIDVIGEQLGRLENHRGWADLHEVMGSPSAYPEVSVFKDKELRRVKLRPDAGELEVLKLGMDVEKKSSEYYAAARDKVENPKAKELFAWLIEEEDGHFAILRAEYDVRAGSGFYYDSAEFSLEVD